MELSAVVGRQLPFPVTVPLLVSNLHGPWVMGCRTLGEDDATAVWVVTIPYRWTGHTRLHQLRPLEDPTLRMQIRTRTMVAWSLWLAGFGCCAAGCWSPWP
jgi:hypothetical protein